MKKRGFFLVVEGADGAGTTTISKYLADEISAMYGKDNVVLTHEPSDYEIGKFIRRILKKKINVESELAMLHLFIADRAEHTLRRIEPALYADKIVISDRYYPSTVIYQSVIEERPLDSFTEMEHLFLNYFKCRPDSFIKPDYVLYLKCDLDILKERRTSRGDEEEKYENEQYQDIVVKLYNQFFGYYKLGFNHEEMDANKDLETVKAKSLKAVSSVLSERERR